jgi:hypothetical protein
MRGRRGHDRNVVGFTSTCLYAKSSGCNLPVFHPNSRWSTIAPQCKITRQSDFSQKHLVITVLEMNKTQVGHKIHTIASINNCWQEFMWSSYNFVISALYSSNHTQMTILM